VAEAVRAAVLAGVSYHSAAGNEATAHYGAAFRATLGSDYHDFATSGAPDNYDEIDVAPGQELDCVLQWDDPFGAATDDYDLELYDLSTPVPTFVIASVNRQTGSQDPYEDFAVVNSRRVVARAGVAIRKVSGGARVLGLFCFGGTKLQYVTAGGSVVGHPAVAEVVTVGAVDAGDPGLDTVEDYSSQGPVLLYVPARATRAKPDLVAFDGVTVSAAGFSPFFGTSAAAPDTAAVAALMLSKNACRLPAQIQKTLTATAVDIGTPGPDSIAEAGRRAPTRSPERDASMRSRP
jgi:subtilisin family serine protease